MKVTLISLGEVKNKNILALEMEYLKRIKPFINFDIKEISTRKLNSLSEAERKQKETELLIQEVKLNDYLVVMDEKGKSLNTNQISAFIKKHMLESVKHIVFAVGGVFGWDEKIKKRADFTLSLSPMTFTYEFARLILTEQLYRSVTIINGIPYHKN